ncbi:hypothetical protein [Microvirga antarctica]|nr:hypothetical protein [Microvirga antarctica]
MTRLLRIMAVIGVGLLATACDKCGNSNFNTPKFCGDTQPRN